ncbi:unnamed protein product, partial [Laminaria digitata]
MATPRQAAAKAKAALNAKKPHLCSGASSSGGDEPKTKVNWADVEASAKREAMWLLNWKKEQAEQSSRKPEGQESPIKKRRKKAASRKVAATTAATTTPGADPVADSLRQEHVQGEKGQELGQGQGHGKGGDSDKAAVRAAATVSAAAEELSSAYAKPLISAKILASAKTWLSPAPAASVGPATSVEPSASAKPLTAAKYLTPEQPTTPAVPVASRQPLTSRQPFTSSQPSPSTTSEDSSPAQLVDSAKPLASAELFTPAKLLIAVAPSTLSPADLSTPTSMDLPTPSRTAVLTPTSTDGSTPTPMDISSPSPTGIPTPAPTALSAPTPTDVSTRVGPQPTSPAPATGSALASMQVEVLASVGDTTAERSSPGTKGAPPSGQGLPVERNSCAAVRQAGGLSALEPAAAAAAVVGGAAVSVKRECSRPTPVETAAKEGSHAATNAVSVAAAGERIGHPPPPRLGSSPRVESLVVPALAPALALPLEPPSVKDVGSGAWWTAPAAIK